MRINSKVVSDKFEDEVVVVNLENGIYYSLKGSATTIWLGIEEGFSRKSIVNAFGAITQEQEEQVSAFFDFVVVEGLVIDESNGRAELNSPALSTFSVPEYLKFNDMAELIMIDPIHEVDPQKGWPHKPA